ncbi:MAG: DUF4276 family protein [Chloroflexota bacterium]
MNQRNKIYAIVEGHGEANKGKRGQQSAIVVLVGRMLHELGCWHLFPQGKHSAYRMSYQEFFTGSQFEQSIRSHKSYPDCAAVLVLLDMDDDCPKEKSAELVQRIHQMERLPFSVVIVCAKCEYESWFLASIESIHEGAMPYDGEPEERRGAKEWLRKQFGYKPTQDQSTYTRQMDFTLVYERSRSFQRLYHAFEEIIGANDAEDVVITPMRNG